MKFHFRWQNICQHYPKWNAHAFPSKYWLVLKFSQNEKSCEQNLFTRWLEISYWFECILPLLWTYSKPINKTFWNVIYVSHLKTKIFINTFLYVLNFTYCFSLKIFLIWMCTIFNLIRKVVLQLLPFIFKGGIWLRHF